MRKPYQASRVASLRVRLALRPRLVEWRKLQAGGIDRDDFGELVERNLEPPRIVNLWHQTDVGDRHMRAARVGPGRDHRLDGGKAVGDPMVVPGVDLRLLV